MKNDAIKHLLYAKQENTLSEPDLLEHQDLKKQHCCLFIKKEKLKGMITFVKDVDMNDEGWIKILLKKS